MAILQAINLGLRFVLELCMLAALGYWGFQLDRDVLLRIVAGLGAPLLAIAVWGMFVAPKAVNQLADPARFFVELVLFALGAGALWLAERPSLGAALLVIYLINRGLIGLLGHQSPISSP
jgi:hypothetical protein